jgi:hypothetical protein
MKTENNKPSPKRVHPKSPPDYPGSDAMDIVAEGLENSYPSGRQVVDNPVAHPPFHFSPDNKMSKRIQPGEVLGWGADLNPADRPAVPKERMPARDIGVHWDAPVPQPLTVKVFHSTERAGVTPLFGTSSPPRGVSGMIRKLGYRWSENDLRRWMTLVLADRVDVIEGIIEDLARGHIPNLYKERGWNAEMRINPKGVARRVAVGTAKIAVPVGLLVLLLRRRQNARRATALAV